LDRSKNEYKKNLLDSSPHQIWLNTNHYLNEIIKEKKFTDNKPVEI